jgi:hypothetical protein
MGGRVAWHVAGMKSIRGSNLQVIRHWCSDKDRAWGPAVFSYVDTGLDDPAIPLIGTVETRSMIDILADDTILSRGSIVSFSSG